MLARNNPAMAFTSLNHYIDYEWLERAYQLTRKDGAVGTDGVTAEDYAVDLAENLIDLLDRIKSGRYQAPLIRRTYIPKADGSQRPLGIPAFEDKIVQRAVVMLLEPIFEQDFYDCSYGFRPQRSAHLALHNLRSDIMGQGGRYILDVDLEKYFDTIDHIQLRQCLSRRVVDGVIRKLIDKWLKAGVLESGSVMFSTRGTPQGGVASPLLANIYLHYVLDEWFTNQVKPRMKGRCSLTRYCDDFVMVFEHYADCYRVQRVLPKRFSRFGLTVNPDKTHRVDFRFIYRKENIRRGKVVNFDFLGFTHYWGQSSKGSMVVMRKTTKARFAKTLKEINQFCRRNRHRSLIEQHAMLNKKLRGHYAYFGITGNSKALRHLHHQVERIWHKWLGRRSRKSYIPWKRFTLFLKRFPLQAPVIYHHFTSPLPANQ